MFSASLCFWRLSEKNLTMLLLWDYLLHMCLCWGSFLSYFVSVLLMILSMVWAGKGLGRWKRRDKKGYE